MEYTKKIVYQSNYWYNDGLRKAKIRDMSGAIMSLRKSLQFNRENIAARNLLGLVYYGIGEVPEALVEWIISKNLKSRDNIADYYIKNVQSSAKKKRLNTVLETRRSYSRSIPDSDKLRPSLRLPISLSERRSERRSSGFLWRLP